MAHFTFHGGIDLQGRKEKTADSPIKEILPGRELFFPIPAGGEPVVILGEYVLSGQLLARGEEEAVPRLHCSVSGIVKSIANGMITIENDKKYKELDSGDFVEADDLENRQILARIKSAGVTDGSNGERALSDRLNIAEPQKIRHVIINCAESEPYLTSKYRCAVERPEWIVEGLRILLKLFPNAKGIFAIENNRPEAITALQKIFADSKNMKIIPMKPKYPQDMERMLIYACTGKKISAEKTPEEARCIVLNADTAYAVCNAVTFGKPMTKRLVTVSGNAVREPANMEVCIGMPLEELYASAGGFTETPEKIISGGPMRGKIVKDPLFPVTKETNALLCLTGKETGGKKRVVSECIGCGFCVDVCCEQLLPTRLASFAAVGDKESFLKFGGEQCCECGSCTYICPSGRNITEMIQKMKQEG